MAYTPSMTQQELRKLRKQLESTGRPHFKRVAKANKAAALKNHNNRNFQTQYTHKTIVGGYNTAKG